MESPTTLGSQTPEEIEERKAALDRGDPFLLFRDGDGRQRIVTLKSPSDAITVGRRFEVEREASGSAEIHVGRVSCAGCSAGRDRSSGRQRESLPWRDGEPTSLAKCRRPLAALAQMTLAWPG